MTTHVLEFDVQRVQQRREQGRLWCPSMAAPALREPVDRTDVATVRVAPPARGGLIGHDAGPAFEARHQMFGGGRNQRPETPTTPQASPTLPLDGEGESGGAVHQSIVTERLGERQCSADTSADTAVATPSPPTCAS